MNFIFVLYVIGIGYEIHVHVLVDASMAKFMELKNTDAKFETNIGYYTGYSIQKCFFACEHNDVCVYISYNEAGRTCELHGLNNTAVTVSGWNMYYKAWDDQTGSNDMDLKSGSTAIQSSTYSGDGITHSADYALDGDTNGWLAVSCSHVYDYYGYWIMEFGMPGVVEKVDMYLRTDFFDRNSNRVVMVTQTSDQALANVGTECGSYHGPLITTAPFLLTINCGRPIFGKFMRISYTKANYLEICEIYVYSP